MLPTASSAPSQDRHLRRQRRVRRLRVAVAAAGGEGSLESTETEMCCLVAEDAEHSTDSFSEKVIHSFQRNEASSSHNPRAFFNLQTCIYIFSIVIVGLP